jgi:fructan beta-fructosidase
MKSRIQTPVPRCFAFVLLLFLFQVSQAQEPLFENSDFSRGNLMNWTVTGEAFSYTPATAAINPGWDVTGSQQKDLAMRWDTRQEMYRQPEIQGYQGHFANSYHPRLLDRSTGQLQSDPFTIEEPSICFLAAAGDFSFPGQLVVNLQVDGKVRRQAIPDSKEMKAYCFDVKELHGAQARIIVSDEHPFFGGWIAADEFTTGGTDALKAETGIIVPRSSRRSLVAGKKYLNIPAQNALPDDAVKLWINGKVVEERMMAVADVEHADFWQFIDLSAWKGKELEVSFEGWSHMEDPLSDLSQDNRIRGIDQLYEEKYRPQFHFSPIQGWSNDVNGTVYYDGEYHLFFQYDPSRIGQIGRNMHWGHAVSKDLFHWKELPIALGTDPQRGQIYSGSAIVDFNNSAGLQQGDEKTMIAFYTRRSPYYLLVHDYGIDSSSQCMAYSLDRGRTWTHVEEPLIPCITTKNRDPKVFWHQESQKWIMVFFKTTGYVFYGSVDLFNWEELNSVDGYHECPDIFQLDIEGDPKRKRWVLVNGGGDYSLGEFDGKGFDLAYRGRTDFGPISATQTFGQAPGGTAWRSQLAWMHVSPPEMPFRQMISLPMDLTLRQTDKGLRIFSNPAKSIKKLHGRTVTIKEKHLSASLVSNQTVPFELFDATFTLQIEPGEPAAFEIRGIPLTYDPSSGLISIENGKSERTKKQKPMVMAKEGHLKIRAILDKCTLDLILNDGEVHLVGEAYPDRSKPALQITAESEHIQIRKASFTEMKSALN